MWRGLAAAVLAAVALAAPAAATTPVAPATGAWTGTARQGDQHFALTFRVDHIGRFDLSDGDILVDGRFLTTKTVRGTIDVAPKGLTCAGATLTFSASRKAPRATVGIG